MEELKAKLKEEIIEVLNLEDISPEDIDNASPLFGDGLGLDSIDALELIVLLEKNYGIKIEDPKDGRKVFYSIDTMAEFIQQHQKN
jgi:acyl carrier protein